MIISNKIKGLLTHLVLKSDWYNNTMFPDCKKFWDYNTFNTKVVNLGSTSGLNAFCYDDISIKSANWALGHNPLLGDLAILKNYFGYLDPKGSTVIITLCPFSSLAGSYSYFEDRYYTLLYSSTMQGYSFRREQQVLAIKNAPVYYYPLLTFFHDIKGLCLPKKKQQELSEQQMVQDAERWIASWEKEFHIKNFSDPLSLLNQDAIEDASKILNEMISFCKNRNIRPVMVIPPVYHTLGKLFTPKIRRVIIDNLMDKILDKTILFYNYMDDVDFTNNRSLFQNSFLLNKKGAKLFTQHVLKDLNISI